MKTYLGILLLVLVGRSNHAQQLNIDSLRRELVTARHDTDRVQKMFWLSFAYDGISHDSAQLYASRSLTLSQKIHDRKGEARALERIAQSYWIAGNYPTSLAESFKALQIAKELDLARETVRSLNNIGNVYLELKDNGKAINYFKQALKLTNEGENGRFAKPLEGNLALAYQKNNQLDSAWYYVQKSYRKGLETTLPLYAHYIHIGVGSIQFDRGNYQDAFKSLRKSVAINTEEKDYRLLAKSYNELARFFRKLNQPDSAIFYARAALDNAQRVGAKQYALEASNGLADLWETRDNQEALTYYKIAKKINEELYGADRVLSLQRIIADEQERLRTIELERETYQNHLKQYTLLAGLGVALLIAFFLYRTYRQQQNANQLLNEQKAKVEQTLMTLKTTQAQLIQREKMASLGELTAGIAHEIQNPLNFVNNFSDLSIELIDELEKEADNQRMKEVIALAHDIKENLTRITHHGNRASTIVKGMLEHSRTSTGQKEPTDLNTLADEYLTIAYQGLRVKDETFNCELSTNFSPNLGLIEVAPQELGRVLLNLYNNAFYAVKEKQKTAPLDYQPTVWVSTAQANDTVAIQVKDNGVGIAESVKGKIFQPFFTTKPTGEGTGLGLSLSYDIVTKGHGGMLTVESIENQFTQFILTLPGPYPLGFT